MSDVTETLPSVEQTEITTVDTKVGISDQQQIIHVVENVVTIESSEMSLACPEQSTNTVDHSNAENHNIKTINFENEIITDVIHDITEAEVGSNLMQYAGQLDPGKTVIQLAVGNTIQAVVGNEVEVVAIISPDGEEVQSRPEPGVFEQTVVADGQVPGQTFQIIASESNPQIISTQELFSGSQWKLSETGNPRSILKNMYKTDPAPVHLVTATAQDTQVVGMSNNTLETSAVSMTDEGTSTDHTEIVENAQVHQACMTDEAAGIDQGQITAEEDGSVEKYTITIQEASDVQMAEFMRSEMNNINMNELSEEDISLLRRRIDGQMDARQTSGDEGPMVTRIIKLPQGTPGAAETLCILSSPETTDPAMIEKMVKAFLASSMGIDVNKSSSSPPTIIMSDELDLPVTNAKISRSNETVNKVVQCPICDKIIAHRNNLQTHIKTHTGEKPFVCGVCNKTFSRKGNLQTHARTHSGLKPFKCNICAKTFIELGHLKKHTRMHTGEKPFPCELCDRMFSQKYSLKSHMIAHSGLKEFVCSYCKKEFCHKGSLQKHVRNHTGNKPHTCSICKKRFAIMTYLKIHMTTHTGLKPYPCELCNKRFAQKSNLQAHMKGHNGIKPFHCSACEKTFAQKCHLLRHLMTHDADTKVKKEKEILPCPVCRKEFRNKASFDKHVRRHDSAFCCDECGKLYADQVSFDKHSKRCAERVRCVVCNKEFPNQSVLDTHAKKHCGTDFKVEPDESTKPSNHDAESVTSNQSTATGDLEQLCNRTKRKIAESEGTSISDDEQETSDPEEGELETEDTEANSQETKEGTEAVPRKRRKVTANDVQDVESNELSDKGTRPEAKADNIEEMGTASINTNSVKMEENTSEHEEKIVSAASAIVHPHFTRRNGRKPARFDKTTSPDAPANKSPRSTGRKPSLLDANTSPDLPAAANKSPRSTGRKTALPESTTSPDTPAVVNKSPRSTGRKSPLLDATTLPDTPAVVNKSPRRTVSSDVSTNAIRSRHVASSSETSVKAKKSPKNLEKAKPPTRTSVRRMEKLKINDKKSTSKTVTGKSSKSMVSAKKAVIGKTKGTKNNKGQSKFLSQINLRKQKKK